MMASTTDSKNPTMMASATETADPTTPSNIWKLYFVSGLKIFLPDTRILRTMPNQNPQVTR